MKKYLTKLLTIICYTLLSITIVSCIKSEYPTTPSKFVIERIVANNTKGTSLYLASPIDKKDLNMSSSWFVDSTGKFNAGDTISFQLIH